MMYLNSSGTGFIVKTITNQQLILNIILSFVKTVPHSLQTLVVYTKNLVLIRHSKMYANSIPLFLVLYILGSNILV